jgi:hypothetical protein
MLPLNGFGQASIFRTQLKLERVAPQRELALQLVETSMLPGAELQLLVNQIVQFISWLRRGKDLPADKYAPQRSKESERGNQRRARGSPHLLPASRVEGASGGHGPNKAKLGDGSAAPAGTPAATMPIAIETIAAVEPIFSGEPTSCRTEARANTTSLLPESPGCTGAAAKRLSASSTPARHSIDLSPEPSFQLYTQQAR